MIAWEPPIPQSSKDSNNLTPLNSIWFVGKAFGSNGIIRLRIDDGLPLLLSSNFGGICEQKTVQITLEEEEATKNKKFVQGEATLIGWLPVRMSCMIQTIEFINKFVQEKRTKYKKWQA